MKIIRSTRCNLKYTTQHKQAQLEQILIEYARVTNSYIDYFWEHPEIIVNKQLLKPTIDQVSTTTTWFTFRMRKVASREALALVMSARNLSTESGTKPIKPKHYGKSMHLSSTIARLKPADSATTFDMWLTLTSIGNKLKLQLPIRLHKHYHNLANLGNSERLESYIISRDRVQLCFKIITDGKKETGCLVGIDTGIKSLATLSDGTQFGLQVESLINKINKCQHGSRRQKRLRRSLKQYIDETVKSLPWDNLQLIVVEKLKGLNKNTHHKSKKSNFKPRFRNKSLRKMLGNWNYRYWLGRLQMATELHRVSFRSVTPYNTSIQCSSCGHTEQGNRSTQEKFLCRKCGYTDNADINAAKNILERFISGPYGARFKPDNISNI